MDSSTSFTLLILTISRPGGYLALDLVYGLTATHPDKEAARDLVAQLLTDRINSHAQEVQLLRLASDAWPLKPEVTGFTITVDTPV
ncbi:hypothetical protein ACIPJN_29785 [Streptomyces sp. NPDC086796]|uniref:hypothetical protein n=1 Tax=Streptomyces sp. NPDC086796 TaxID=3365760 RepID=UPI003818598C